MDEIKLEDIKSAGNPRKDLGDLAELAESIKVHGIIVPLVLNKNKELMAGHRRVAAAKMAGLKTAPYIIKDGEDGFAVSMVENLQRKDLNPIEEAQAYQGHMKKAKVTVKGLAGAIGKTEAYVQKRLDLLKAHPDVQQALATGRIQLGHAVILGRMEEAAQLAELKGIVKEKPSVRSFAENLASSWGERARTADLSEASFDKKECATCPHNGGCQALLTETGDNTLKGVCLKPSCFQGKSKAHLEQEKKKLADKGYTVVNPDRMDSNEKVEEIHSWNKKEYEEAVKKLATEPKKYAVGVSLEDGKVEKHVYLLDKGAKVNKDNGDPQEVEKQLNMDRKERLASRVKAYKQELVVKTSMKLAATKPDTHQVKALIAYRLIGGLDGLYDWEEVDKELSVKKVFPEYEEGLPDMNKLLKLTEAQLDQVMARLVAYELGMMDSGEDLETIAKALGFDIQKHFKLDEAYLDMHTIDQLQKLAKELVVDLTGKADRAVNDKRPITKAEIVKAILDAKPKKVPKAIVDAKLE